MCLLLIASCQGAHDTSLLLWFLNKCFTTSFLNVWGQGGNSAWPGGPVLSGALVSVCCCTRVGLARLHFFKYTNESHFENLMSLPSRVQGQRWEIEFFCSYCLLVNFPCAERLSVSFWTPLGCPFILGVLECGLHLSLCGPRHPFWLILTGLSLFIAFSLLFYVFGNPLAMPSMGLIRTFNPWPRYFVKGHHPSTCQQRPLFIPSLLGSIFGSLHFTSPHFSLCCIKLANWGPH